MLWTVWWWIADVGSLWAVGILPGLYYSISALQSRQDSSANSLVAYADLLERWLVYWPVLFLVYQILGLLENFYQTITAITGSSVTSPSLILCITYLMAKYSIISWIRCNQASGAVKLFASAGIPLYQSFQPILAYWYEAAGRLFGYWAAWMIVNGWDAILWAQRKTKVN